MPTLRFHGISSMLLFLIACGTGIASGFRFSLPAGILIGAGVLISFLSLALFYCRKCRCRNRCHHILMGRISGVLSGPRKPPYSTFDMIAAFSPLLITLAGMQFILVKTPSLLAFFWILFFLAGSEVYLFICNRCSNSYCRMCRLKNE